MMGGSGRDPRDHDPAGGPAHVPVLREAVLAALAMHRTGAQGANPDAIASSLYLDGTFGAGGYTRALLALPGTMVLALDRDPTAIAAGAPLVADAAGRLVLVEDRFSHLDRAASACGLGPFDGVALDIGVSSMQLDQADRGFSFRHDGPLDMRMGRGGPSAADLIATASVETLADIFFYYGEERASRRIARAIVADRATTPFTTTRPLAEMIARVNPAKPTDIHPATRTFQALRIAVNDELGELVRGLAAAERVLKPGGCLAVVTFHSLEDRIVKQFFAKRSGRGEAAGRRLPGEPAALEPSFSVPRGQPVVASPAEIAANPRARSAKLRFGLRTDSAPRELGADLLNLALLPGAEASGVHPSSGKASGPKGSGVQGTGARGADAKGSAAKGSAAKAPGAKGH